MKLTLVVRGHDAGKYLITKYCRRIPEMYPIREDHVSAQAHKLKVQYGNGLHAAFADAFEMLIIESRIARYGLLIDNITCPPSFEIEVNLLPAIEEAYHSTWVVKESGTWDTELFWEALIPVVMSYIYPEDLEKKFEKIRRERILDGTLDPVESDMQWIEEHAKSLEQKATDIRERMKAVPF